MAFLPPAAHHVLLLGLVWHLLFLHTFSYLISSLVAYNALPVFLLETESVLHCMALRQLLVH